MQRDEMDATQHLKNLRSAMEGFWPLPETAAEMLVMSFIFKNLEAFQEFLSSYPKKYEVTAVRWLQSVFRECEKIQNNYETSQIFGVSRDSDDSAVLRAWSQDLRQEENHANTEYFSAMKKNEIDGEK